MKQTVKLSEAKLRNLIKESVRKAMKESFSPDSGKNREGAVMQKIYSVMDILDEISNMLHEGYSYSPEDGDQMSMEPMPNSNELENWLDSVRKETQSLLESLGY